MPDRGGVFHCGPYKRGVETQQISCWDSSLPQDRQEITLAVGFSSDVLHMQVPLQGALDCYAQQFCRVYKGHNLTIRGDVGRRGSGSTNVELQVVPFLVLKFYRG